MFFFNSTNVVLAKKNHKGKRILSIPMRVAVLHHIEERKRK